MTMNLWQHIITECRLMYQVIHRSVNV